MHSGRAGKTSMLPQLPCTSTVSLPHARLPQSECGIRRLHGKLIAQEILQLVKADATKAAEGGMVTLAVEGNISAGKSTFLDVLSHDDTNLRDELQVGAR